MVAGPGWVVPGAADEPGVVGAGVAGVAGCGAGATPQLGGRRPRENRLSAAESDDALVRATVSATDAAVAARDRSGWASEGWEQPQRHAFAVLTFGIASAAAAAHRLAAEQVPDIAADALRQAVRLPFREAVATVDAIVRAMTANVAHPAVQALVKCGWLAGNAWLQDDRAAFEACVVQATASDAYASDRPLL